MQTCELCCAKRSEVTCGNLNDIHKCSERFYLLYEAFLSALLIDKGLFCKGCSGRNFPVVEVMYSTYSHELTDFLFPTQHVRLMTACTDFISRISEQCNGLKNLMGSKRRQTWQIISYQEQRSKISRQLSRRWKCLRSVANDWKINQRQHAFQGEDMSTFDKENSLMSTAIL